jgi:GNAT superfamily N-acetyltransferase
MAPSAPLPVRPATSDDHAVFARLFPELGVSDPLPTPEQFAARMVPRMVVLEDAGGAVGYAFWQVYGRTAHVVQVVVDPRARGRGAGRALMQEVRRRVAGEGCTRWYLNVKQDNGAAMRLYERCGLAIEQQGWAVRIRWAQLAALTGPRDAVLFTPAPADDPDVAALLGIDVERVVLLRAREGVVLRALREGEGLVAFGAFDPAFPGVYPVRVARPELAGALFDGFRAQARTDDVNVFVEGDRGLFEALSRAGAQLSHALYRMGAAL